MTLLGFFIGVVLMAIGFLIVWRTNYLIQWFGDIGEAFGAVGMPWLSWKMFGVIMLFVGFFVAFGLFQAILAVTIGRLFIFGELR
jgi:hypothetical protein